MATLTMTSRAKTHPAVTKTWNEATETWDESASLFEPDETWDNQRQGGMTMTSRSKSSALTMTSRSK